MKYSIALHDSHPPVLICLPLAVYLPSEEFKSILTTLPTTTYHPPGYSTNLCCIPLTLARTHFPPAVPEAGRRVKLHGL